MTLVFVCTLMTTVFVCTLITIVFVCMIINCCFGVVFYINMCIAHAKISFISQRGTTFKPSEFLVKTPVTGQTGPVNRSVNRSEPVTHAILNLVLNSTGLDHVVVCKPTAGWRSAPA